MSISNYYLERLGPHDPAAAPIPLRIGANTIGRLPTNNIVLSSKYASRKHCTLFVTETDQLTAKNDATTNGIFINGTQKTNRDVEICLNPNDILGVGCDTSKDEIGDTECFIFSIRRNKTEVLDDEIISLDESDEEEYKIQEEYSQMNISAMKQEYMELEDFVDELNSVKNEEDVGYAPNENPVVAEVTNGKNIVGDVFEEIIANSDKSYAQKAEMIKNIVPEADRSGEPDVSSFLMKDCAVTRNGERERSSILTKDCAMKEKGEVPSNKTKETKEKISKPKKREKKEPPERRNDRHHSKAAKDQFKTVLSHKNSSKVEHSPPPQIKELQVTIPLRDISSETKPTPKNRELSAPEGVEKVLRNSSYKSTGATHSRTSNRRNSIVPSSTTPTKKEYRNDSKKSTEPTHSRILKRRNTFVPSSTASPVQEVCQNESTKPAEATHSRILKRRNTFVPSSTLSNGPTKRQLEIINAPPMMKRRKSISAMPESHVPSPKPKNGDVKWLSKNVQHKRRSLEEKNEIKSKLAALVPDPKDKIVEAKATRTNTKIPVKNTHRTRNDQLTDTIVKTITTTSRKHKLNVTNLATEACKRLRTTEHEVAAEDPNKIQLRRTSIAPTETDNPKQIQLRRTSIAPTENNPKQIQLRRTSIAEKEVVKSAEVKPNDEVSDNQPISDPNKNVNPAAASTTAPASHVVKSILKKSNSIQKRRVTVTFAEQPRIKTISPIAPVVPAVRSEEDNVDDVIHNIMALGMSALKESSSASINGKNFSYKPVAHEYTSLGHLQNVFVPLMKAELWKEIVDGYSYSKNTQATNVQMNYCSRDENYPNRFKCHCETQSSAAIQSGALIMMLGVNFGKEFLGYITNRQITNKVCYFQFLTTCSMEPLGGTPTPLKLKQIMYIRPNLKVFEALFKLKHSPLLQHILHPKQNCSKPLKQPFKFKGYNSLNQDQMITLSTVYRKCVGGLPFISLIEGPPGTGKSRLITNLVLQLLYGKEISQPLKILVCAPSNAAVDILTKNLMEARKNYVIEKGQKKMKLVRFGVLEKMEVSVRGVSIQGLTNLNEKTILIEQNKLMECKRKKEAELSICTAKHARDKISAIRNEIAVIESKIKNVAYDEKCLLEGANVICTTLNSCCALSSKIARMDVCIIDEATQCNEPASLIPLQFGVKSLILVGDTKQLPSTVVSEIAKQYNYDQSLFQRLQKSFESESKFENPILQLTTQYRMHPDILHWPNQYFYKNQLTSAEQTSDKLVFKLKPYTVFNLNFVQSLHTGQKHISNVDEAKFVRHLLDFLLTKADPKRFSYGIISAYSQQTNDLAKVLSSTHPYVTVNTIDSCQGQERDIVIISIARTRGIGFLAIRQRLNVALTRAKKMLILCGNFNSLQSHPMWTSLLEDAKNRRLYVHLPTMDDSSLASYFYETLTT